MLELQQKMNRLEGLQKEVNQLQQFRREDQEKIHKLKEQLDSIKVRVASVHMCSIALTMENFTSIGKREELPVELSVQFYNLSNVYYSK